MLLIKILAYEVIAQEIKWMGKPLGALRKEICCISDAIEAEALVDNTYKPNQ